MSCEACKAARGVVGGVAGFVAHEFTGITYVALGMLSLPIAIGLGAAVAIWGPGILGDAAFSEENRNPPKKK